MASLLDLFEEKESVVKELNALGIPGVTYEAEPSVKCGITGLHVSVKVDGVEEDEELLSDHHHDHEHDHEHHHDHEHDHDHHHDHEHEHHHDHDHSHHHHHHHTSLQDVRSIVEAMPVSAKVKADVMEVYTIIAEAEGHVHGKPMEEIHFHEVGTMDAIADVTGVCLLMEKLGNPKVIASPVHVGSGQVRCAHGILPVPAPATAHILRDVPIYGGKIRGELCTPTGAALLKKFASDFGEMPVMKTEAIGYGCGKKDFEAANCVRAILGETKDNSDRVAELSCNLDDCSAEEIGFAMEALLAAGALDVYTIPIGMKKNRPGIMLNVLCKEADKAVFAELIFKHTTTIGIRESLYNRYTLTRSTETVETVFGPVRKKISSGYGTRREKFEYEDLARIAADNHMSIAEVRSKI